ncbi:T9SS type A sorting domain-containing protein [bacterium]|nr:T9SS type A sorting domain-containing protein [bacterium]
MNTRFVLFVLSILLLVAFFAGHLNSQTIYTIPEAYTSADVEEGDTIGIIGYFEYPGYPVFLDHYSDLYQDQPFPPQSVMMLDEDGPMPPAEAWFGGLVLIHGRISFVDEPYYYNPEDTLIGIIFAFGFDLLIPGDSAISAFRSGERDEGFREDRRDLLPPVPCDSCKFAILMSGGIRAPSNKPKYWNNLAYLYKLKVDSLGYCPGNIKVLYFDGERPDSAKNPDTYDDIPADRVDSCTIRHVRNAHREIARAIARRKEYCESRGRKIEFQKMVTNHGSSDGGICMLGNDDLHPDSLKAYEQMIIDSCCQVMYDEFTQCYGGYVTDALRDIDIKNKTTLHVNSAVNHRSGWSPTYGYHAYLKAKVDALRSGMSYEGAVVAAKRAYDDYIQNRILPMCHNKLNDLYGKLDDLQVELEGAATHEDSVRIQGEINKVVDDIIEWEADSAQADSSICESPNYTEYPMKKYCDWQAVYIPPGGQGKIDFKGDPSSCGNTTVYKFVSTPDFPYFKFVKVKVWNWNVPGSLGFTGGNNTRVLNSDETGTGWFYFHNDDSTYTITVDRYVTQELEESRSNELEFAGFSYGGNDDLSDEFGVIYEPFYAFVESLNLSLDLVPRGLGPEGGVSELNCLFTYYPNPYWEDMELYLDIINVMIPGPVQLIVFNGLYETFFEFFIEGPGVYRVDIGSFLTPTSKGKSVTTFMTGQLTFNIPDGYLTSFEFDCWGLRSRFDYVVGIEDEQQQPEKIPMDYRLYANFPNPFNAQTNIFFALPHEAKVSLEIYNILGEKVENLISGKNMKAGYHRAVFKSDEVTTGIYFYRLTADDFAATGKMLIVK